MTYQRWLEAEVMSMKQHLDLETSRTDTPKENLAQLETEIKRLQDENQQLVQDKQKIITEKDIVKTERQKCEVICVEIKKAHDIIKEENVKVKDEIQKVRVKLNEDGENYVKEIQGLNSKIVQQAQRVAELEAKEAELTFLKSTCEQLQEKNAEDEKIKIDLMESMKMLQEDVTSLRTDIQHYQTQLNDQEQQLVKWQSKAEERQVQLDQLYTKVEKYRQDLEKGKERRNQFETDIQRHKAEIDRYKSSVDKQRSDLEICRAEIEHRQREVEELQTKVSNTKEERDRLANNMHSLESAYKKDLATQKQKQEDVNARLRKAEKSLKDVKQHYRSEMEKVKNSLEMENSVAMETMKNKMVEMQKGHLLAMESLRKQYKSELSDITKKLKEQRKRELNSTEVQTDSEDQDDDGFMELREQYLDTVGKIKDDVMKHITETNLRAAETVRCEMIQERNTTLQELKRIYMENVRKILQNEILEANIEAKLADIEHALEVISFDNPGSRPETPGSSSSSTPTPRNNRIDRQNESKDTSVNTSVDRNTSSQQNHSPLPDHNDYAIFNDKSESSGRTHSSMLPLKDNKVPSAKHPQRERSISKGVTFSQHLEDRHSRAKSLPGRTYVLGSDRFVTFRSPSPDVQSSSDNSDSEYYSHRLNTKEKVLTNKFSVPTSTQSSRVQKDFSAFHPGNRQMPDQLLGQSSLYKTVSEPELAVDKQQTHYRDFTLSNYKYTSLRDSLGKSPSNDNSISQLDLRLYTDSLSADKKSYSVEVGLQGLGLERTSPRRFNPSPERLSTSRDAGESPIETPRAHSRTHSHRPVSSSDVINVDELKFGNWDSGKRPYGYRYKKPVKNLVEKFQKMGTESTDLQRDYLGMKYS